MREQKEAKGSENPNIIRRKIEEKGAGGGGGGGDVWVSPVGQRHKDVTVPLGSPPHRLFLNRAFSSKLHLQVICSAVRLHKTLL